MVIFLQRSNQQRKWERQEEERHQLIIPDKFVKFETSKASRDAVILLGKLSGTHNVLITQNQYTLLHDFLLVQIPTDNANRAGVLANITVKSSKGSQKMTGLLSMSGNIKTFHIHGHVQVVLTSNLHNWMNVFIQEVRSQAQASEWMKTSPVFPSFNGTKMQSSKIYKAIKYGKKQGLMGLFTALLLGKVP